MNGESILKKVRISAAVWYHFFFDLKPKTTPKIMDLSSQSHLARPIPNQDAPKALPRVAPEACKQLQYRSQGFPRGSKTAPKRTKTAFKSLP